VRWRSFRPALVAGLLALSREARAQDAKSLFEEGLAEMTSGRYKIGCALIKRSLDIESRPGAVFTLAECYSKAGRIASAVEMYDRYLGLFEAMTGDQRQQHADRAEISKRERTRLIDGVPWLTITLPKHAPAGVVVTRDGEPFAPDLFGVALAVDPGVHVFTTRAPDGPLIQQRIELGLGDRKAAVLDVRSAGGDTAVPPPPPPIDGVPPEPDRSPGPNPWVYVTGAVGAAGLLTGGITGLVLLDKRRIIHAECDADKVCTPKGKDAADLAQNVLAPVTTVGFVVGGVGAAATVVLLLAAPSSGDAATSAWVPSAAFDEHGASVGVSGRF
jgi:hypothetical protein